MTAFSECPKCGGDIWDNRQKKRAGEFSPKAPDFACKDKDDCGWKGWPDPGAKGASKASGATAAPSGSTTVPWKRLAAIAKACADVGIQLFADDLQAAQGYASTIFIAATKNLRLEVPEARPKKQEPPPPPEPEDLDEMPEALQDEEDDLPF